MVVPGMEPGVAGAISLVIFSTLIYLLILPLSIYLQPHMVRRLTVVFGSQDSLCKVAREKLNLFWWLLQVTSF